MKTHAFRLLSSSRRLDLKVYEAYRFLTMPFGKAPYLFYPRVYKVTEVLDVPGRQHSYGTSDADLDWGFFTDETEQTMVKPKVVAARQEKITNADVYLMDNGEYLNLFVGGKIPDEFAQEVSQTKFNHFCERSLELQTSVSTQP